MIITKVLSLLCKSNLGKVLYIWLGVGGKLYTLQHVCEYQVKVKLLHRVIYSINIC